MLQGQPALVSYDDRLVSFRNSPFPANDFCKYTRAVDYDVIFLAIVRLHTYGSEVPFVRDDISRELLSGFSVVSLRPIGKNEPISLLANPAPLSTMYTVTSVLSYTNSVPHCALSGHEMHATSESTFWALTDGTLWDRSCVDVPGNPQVIELYASPFVSTSQCQTEVGKFLMRIKVAHTVGAFILC